MSQSEEGAAEEKADTTAAEERADTTAAEETSDTTSAASQTEGPAVGGDGEPVAEAEDDGAGRSKVAAVAAGTGAAVAGIAGGIAVAARDTRRRVLGVPVGKRSRFQRGASAVVDKVQEPARRLGSRFSRDD